MRYSAGNVTTAVMFALTVWTIAVRMRSRPDSNWPLIFNGMLAIYSGYFPGRLNSVAIYISVVTALFQRFEFMSGFFRYVFMTFELIALALTSYLLFDSVFI